MRSYANTAEELLKLKIQPADLLNVAAYAKISDILSLGGLETEDAKNLISYVRLSFDNRSLEMSLSFRLLEESGEEDLDKKMSEMLAEKHDLNTKRRLIDDIVDAFYTTTLWYEIRDRWFSHVPIALDNYHRKHKNSIDVRYISSDRPYASFYDDGGTHLMSLHVDRVHDSISYYADINVQCDKTKWLLRELSEAYRVFIDYEWITKV